MLAIRLICLIFIYPLGITAICGPGISTPGWTIPKGDIIIPEGTPLEIFCVLDSNDSLATNYTANDLIFKNANSPVDSRYVTVINATTARLYIENLPVSNEMYYCSLRDNLHDNQQSYSVNSFETQSATSDRLICLNSVVIGKKPGDVENFRCVSYNWEILNCTWTEPFNGIKTNYSIYYTIPNRAGRGGLFSCPIKEDGRCSWTLHSSPPYRRNFDNLNFIVEGVNKFGNSSQVFKIHHFAHIIPAAPQSLTSLSKTQSSVYLQWSIGALQFFEKGLIYNVTYTWNSSISWTLITYHSKNLTKDGEKVSVNVTGLPFPNKLYDFRVYMKSAVANNASWSRPATLVVRTKPCAPYHSPKTDIGSFMRVNDDVLVYWRPIPDDEHNGDNFMYRITKYEEDHEIGSVSVTKPFFKFTNLSSNFAYRFVIVSINAEGHAPYSTIVTVPRKRDLIPEPILFTKVDYGGGLYELSWVLQNTPKEVNNVTIFQCESNHELPYQCEAITKWQHLKPEIGKYNFTTSNHIGNQFAISVNTANSSSGMTWAMCTLLHDQVNKMKNVWFDKVGPTFVDIHWRLDCSERVENIRGFNITYCPVTENDKNKCQSPEQWYLVYGDLSITHANITQLKPFTWYKVYVFMFTNDKQGPPSDPIYNRTAEGIPDVTDVEVGIINTTSSSVFMKWNAPKVVNGIINGYKVRYENQDGKINETKIVNDTSFTLTDLISYTDYRIYVGVCTTNCVFTNYTNVRTKIGAPSEIKTSAFRINSSHARLNWSQPLIRGGPFPVFEIRVSRNDKIDSTFEKNDTSAIVKMPCESDNGYSAYTFDVRAKNKDDSVKGNIGEYYGPWSAAYTIDCQISGFSGMLKMMLTLLGCLGLFSVLAFYGKKEISKCQEIRKLPFVLPPEFLSTESYANEIKDATIHADIQSWTGTLEASRLNAKLSEIDESCFDYIDIDMDKTRDTSRSSSGCYTN